MNTKMKILSICSLLLGTSFAFNAFADDGKESSKKRITAQLLGAGLMYENTVPDIDGDGIDDLAWCFDVDLMDVKSGRKIGTATDCIANLTPVGGGLSADATFTLNIKGKGSLVVRTKSTAAPVTRETTSTNDANQSFTHVAGGSSHENRVLSGTGIYKYSTGTVRFSGLMDFSKFNGQPGEQVFLDCIFIIEVDLMDDYLS